MLVTIAGTAVAAIVGPRPTGAASTPTVVVEKPDPTTPFANPVPQNVAKTRTVTPGCGYTATARSGRTLSVPSPNRRTRACGVNAG